MTSTSMSSVASKVEWRWPNASQTGIEVGPEPAIDDQSREFSIDIFDLEVQQDIPGTIAQIPGGAEPDVEIVKIPGD